VKDRLARWRANQQKALGLEQTETLPDISQEEINDIKHRLGRREQGP
jgi:hypothetical protein